ncbi:MAG: ABC transporter permease [Propionibacteriaceae bacterium]|jgi:ABC transporter DrrB family efflux protein|nr:ABC transporter permease [Propionibacteriaceae bacterium]
MTTPQFAATAARVLKQLRNDRRTIALLVVMPSVLIGLFAWLFNSGQMFQRVGPVVLALFPFLMMFLVTSITTLRERTSGTLERLMTTPMTKSGIILGYATAFALFAVVQSLIAVLFAVYVCDLTLAGSMAALLVFAVADALLGTAMGLFLSAFARTEFQAIQFFPLFIVPQIILGGVFMPIDQMPRVLEILARCFPFTYGIEGVANIAAGLGGWDVWRPFLVVVAFVVGFIVLGSLTLPRRTR